jgi:hypothetical protein
MMHSVSAFEQQIFGVSSNCVFVSLYCNVIWNFEMMKNNHVI